MPHLLDRPVYTALATRHAGLALGDDRARRFRPDIIPFAAAANDSPESLAALAALVGDGETLVMPQAGGVALPPGLSPVSTLDGVQMVAAGPLPPAPDARIEALGEADAAEMLALATLTKPGPFSLKSQALGSFFGIRIGGRLAAMAGERFKQPGFTELSGLCTHPDFQRQGLGRTLLLYVAGRIAAAGDIPYLHTYADNRHAIALYEAMGFAVRTPMTIAVVRRTA